VLVIHELRMRCNRYGGTVEQLSYTLDYIFCALPLGTT